MSLPPKVIRRDQELDDAYQEAANRIMEHRWHWTLDQSNPQRVSLREYARSVGKSYTTIHGDANGWAEYLKLEGNDPGPGSPATPTEFSEAARMGGERKYATEALARETGKTFGNTARSGRKVVDAVVGSARARAERRGTSVESEIETGAKFHAKAQQATQRERDERKKRSTATLIKVEGKIGQMMARGREILAITEGVEFSDDEREIIVDTLSKLRALLHLVDIRIAGETDVDWDAELMKITG